MASIFTFDPDPPRVASPWLTPTGTPKPSSPQPRARPPNSNVPPPTGLLADYGVTRLEAEPQEGPTEYKLHLLLRPRRNYSSSSTGTSTSATHHSKHQTSNQNTPHDSGNALAPSSQSRQHRLEQLTTQLLWRLQQSSSYHASSTSDLVLPKLPEALPSLQTPSRPAKLLAGLEDSRGALYEIGVSDDGTFVGLTEDEMNESLNNLRAMAASLGCNVEVVRKVVVGDCEWHESILKETGGGELSNQTILRSKSPLNPNGHSQTLRRQGKLWVAEALVTPDLSSRHPTPSFESNFAALNQTPPPVLLNDLPKDGIVSTSETTDQLRITLTGPTTSGKSSLLGTLTTATLDNGRGKSRLSLLKHRHEIASGITSSVAQELIGYKGLDVVNYASGNVTSWTDIHAAAEHGRLVLMSDFPGHPRYRRTTVRGLIGWAPHWTMLCIAADDGDNAPSNAGGTSSAQDILGVAGAGIDLARAHLELCLKLNSPLVVVITKLDLASRTNLKQNLSKILSAIKTTGRTPLIVSPDQSKQADPDLTTISEGHESAVEKVLGKITSTEDLTTIVPIIMTSSADGSGIRSFHALLKNLPIPPAPSAQDYIGLALNPEQPACLFHIEDVFDLPASLEPLAFSNIKHADSGVVVAGYLRFGRLKIGDIVVIGPFPAELDENDMTPDKSGARSSPGSLGISQSHSSSSELARIVSRNIVSASVTKGEWHCAHIVSMRNLRLPVRTMEAGQVGTIGVVFDILEEEVSNGPFERAPPTVPRIRKGLVMAIPSRHMIQTGLTLQAASGFTAAFEDGDINSVTSGSLVVVYIASIRASAKVLKLIPHANNELGLGITNEESDDVFGLEDGSEQGPEHEPLIFGSDGVTDVKFELLTNREWIELGSQVLVMPGGGHGLYLASERGEKGVAGLEGFVGKIIEVVD